MRRWTDVSSTSTIRVPFARRRGFAVVPLLLIAPFVVVWLTGSSALAAASTTTALHDSCGYDHSPGNAPTASRYYAAPGPSSLSGFNFVSAMAARSGATIDRLPSLTGPCFATNSADDLLDLTTPGARSHILDGEVRPNGTYSGGHRPGTGFPGKSEFPSGWSDGRILHEISDVATDPAATRIVQGSRTVVTGSRGGVDIRVVVDTTTGEIVTGYPTNMPINR